MNESSPPAPGGASTIPPAEDTYTATPDDINTTTKEGESDVEMAAMTKDGRPIIVVTPDGPSPKAPLGGHPVDHDDTTKGKAPVDPVTKDAIKPVVAGPSDHQFLETREVPEPDDNVQIGPRGHVLKAPDPLGPEFDMTPPLKIMLPLQIGILVQSGKRYDFKIDKKYLAKSNKKPDNEDPLNLTVSDLKDLILKEWRKEWEVAPTSSDLIRLIYFGKLLQDDMKLNECRFDIKTANVVLMSIKPNDPPEEEEGLSKKNGKGKGRADRRAERGEESNANRCCVIL